MTTATATDDNVATMSNASDKSQRQRSASPPPPPPPSSTPPSSPPKSLDNSHRSRSAPVSSRYSPTTHDNNNKYFPKNRPRSRTPSPNSDSEQDGSRLLRDWKPGRKDTVDNPFPLHNAQGRIPLRRTGSAQVGNLKTAKKTKAKRHSMIRRTLSTGSNHSTTTAKSDRESYYRNSMASLFQVSFPAHADEMARVQTFQRIDPAQKQELWYFAKELRYLMACEVERNRAYEEGELELPDGCEDEEEVCCWRGLEHVWEGDDRSTRIRKTVTGIVNWHQDAKEMGYNDPDELRVVSKARTKTDRTRAQKKATQDAAYVKKMIKAESGGGGSGEPSSPTSNSLSPKKIVKRLNKKINTALPALHWSPKPNKKEKASAATVTATASA